MNESYDSSEAMGPDLEEELGKQDWVDSATKYTMTVLYVIILLFSLFGNSLLIHLVRTRIKVRKKQFNWLIVNTAVADLVDVITASAFSMPFIIFGDRWGLGIVGTILCKLIPFFLVVSICVAIWTLTAIAIDRYLAIVCLRRRPLSSRSVLRCIFVFWLLAGLIGSGQLYKFKTTVAVDEEEGYEEGRSGSGSESGTGSESGGGEGKEGGGTFVCYDEWHESSEKMSIRIYKAEMVVRVVITYAVPLFIMAVLYWLIARFLWQRKPPGNVNKQAYIKQIRKRRTVIKMMITVVTVFAVCWLPVHVCHINSEFYREDYYTIPTILKFLFYWLAHANAAIHPWLFISFNESLREEAKGIFRKVVKRNKMELRSGSTLSLVTNDVRVSTIRSRPYTPKDSTDVVEHNV